MTCHPMVTAQVQYKYSTRHSLLELFGTVCTVWNFVTSCFWINRLTRGYVRFPYFCFCYGLELFDLAEHSKFLFSHHISHNKKGRCRRCLSKLENKSISHMGLRWKIGNGGKIKPYKTSSECGQHGCRMDWSTNGNEPRKLGTTS